MPPSRTIEEAVRSYFSITRGARMLAVFDVSGSMGQQVPGAGGATRMDLARRAAAGAMPLLPRGSEVGLWEFATDLVGRSDHRELVSVGPLDGPDGGDDRRAALALGVAGLQQIPDGGTGLYDTTLAAVRAVRHGWDPDRVNSVVLLTDGRNDDSDGIDLAALLAQLRAEDDPQRPVPVISLVYGPDADAAALRAISEATGGATYVARDPRQVGQIMLDAFGRRACRPAC
jgi:Ca-activated chloride channel family protein